MPKVFQLPRSIVTKRVSSPTKISKSVIAGNTKTFGQSEYKLFRLAYEQSHKKAFAGKGRREVTELVKTAWNKRKEEIVEKTTPYSLFRVKFTNQNRELLKGKLKSEITHITKTEWKKLSNYQVHRYKWLCEHHSELEGKSEKQITQNVKEAWRTKVDEITAKAKIRKARAKEVARRKEEGSRVSLKKCRDEKSRIEWRKRSGKKPKLSDGEDYSDYTIFRFGYMEMHRAEFMKLDEKECTARVRSAWKEQQTTEHLRIVARVAKRKRAKVAEDIGLSATKMGFVKGELSPYLIFNAGYRVLHNLGANESSKEVTKTVKAEWQKRLNTKLVDIRAQLKKEANELKVKKQFQRQNKIARMKRTKSVISKKFKAVTPSEYKVFRSDFLEKHKDEIKSLSAKEITKRVKMQWWKRKPTGKRSAVDVLAGAAASESSLSEPAPRKENSAQLIV
eukprot:Stramenopile-MAST_4_protein_4895